MPSPLIPPVAGPSLPEPTCPPSAPPLGEAGGYKSVVCEEDAYLLELIRYIHLNPLRAKLVQDLNELDTYPWSGHSAILGRCKNPLVPEVRDQRSEVSKQDASLSEGLFVAGNQVPDSLLQQQKEQNPPAPLNRVPFQGVQLGCNPRNPCQERIVELWQRPPLRGNTFPWQGTGEFFSGPFS